MLIWWTGLEVINILHGFVCNANRTLTILDGQNDFQIFCSHIWFWDFNITYYIGCVQIEIF